MSATKKHIGHCWQRVQAPWALKAWERRNRILARTIAKRHAEEALVGKERPRNKSRLTGAG